MIFLQGCGLKFASDWKHAVNESDRTILDFYALCRY